MAIYVKKNEKKNRTNDWKREKKGEKSIEILKSLGMDQ